MPSLSLSTLYNYSRRWCAQTLENVKNEEEPRAGTWMELLGASGTSRPFQDPTQGGIFEQGSIFLLPSCSLFIFFTERVWNTEKNIPGANSPNTEQTFVSIDRVPGTVQSSGDRGHWCRRTDIPGEVTDHKQVQRE